MSVLDHDDCRVHHCADGDGDAAQRHDVGGHIQSEHRQERKDNGYWQRDDSDEGGTDVPQEDEAHQGHDDAFLNELLSQSGDGAFDEITPVVSHHHFHALRDRRLDLFEFLLAAINAPPRVDAIAHHDYAANDLALAVQFCRTPPDVRSEMHDAHVLHVNRRPLHRLERDVFDVLDFFDVAAPPHVIL